MEPPRPRDETAAIQPAARPRHSPWPLLTLKLLLAAGIVGWLCTGRLDLRLLVRMPFSAHLVTLVLLVFASLLVPVLRWWILLRVQKIHVSLWRATTLTWLGYLTGLVLPGAVGGDLAKSYLITRDQPGAAARALSTVLVDRLLGFYSLIILGALSAAWLVPGQGADRAFGMMIASLVVVTLGSVLGMIALTLRPAQQLLARFAPAAWIEAWNDSCRLYAQGKLAVAGGLALSLGSSALTALSLAAADRALGGSVAWMASLALGPLVVLANAIPLTPGGIGFAEAASSQLFGTVGNANGAEMMLAIRVVMVLLSLPAVLVLFARRPVRISSSPRPGTPEPARRAEQPGAERHAA
jgi:glycosyltransferase 2 family protein